MATGFSTGSNVGASDSGLGVSSSDNSAIARDQGIALGQNATLKTGNDIGTIGSGASVTIGETGLGATFANTIRDITEQNTNTLSTLLSSRTGNSLPNAATDVPSSTDTTTDGTKPADFDWTKVWWGLGALAILLALTSIFKKN
jgi:hypothetical protein